MDCFDYIGHRKEFEQTNNNYNELKMSFCSGITIYLSRVYLIYVHQPSIANDAYVRMHRLNVVPLLWRL